MNGVNPMPQYYRPPPAQASPPQSQVVCSGCRTLLMYPQGAQNVRCARCGHITPVPTPCGGDMAQLVCSNSACRVVLMYPRGANQVQCSICGNVNCAMAANQVGHLKCALCQITLMYAHGAQSVKCAVCNHVTPVQPGTVALLPTPSADQTAAGQAGASSSAAKPTQTVVVENPPTLDDHGNEVQNIAVGVASERPSVAAAKAS